MKHALTARIAAMLLALGAMDAICATPRASRTPRTPLQPQVEVPESAAERRTRKTMEMDAWLRRLVGRYYQFSRITMDGTLKNYYKDGGNPDGSVATRLIDCVAIGSGPGVLCTSYAIVQKPGEEVSYRFNMLVEFGLDPNASRIRILMVGSDGSVGESTAVLSGDTASWLGMSCSTLPLFVNMKCQRTLSISLPADSKQGTWAYGSRLGSRNWGRELVGAGAAYLYRLSPEEGNGPDGLPRTMPDPIIDIEARFDWRTRPPGPR